MNSKAALKSVCEQKTAIREQVMGVLNSYDPAALKRKSQDVGKNLFADLDFLKSKHVLFYLSLDKEVRTDEMIAGSLQLGQSVYVPLVDRKKRQLRISRLGSLSIEFDRENYGIREPKPEYLDIVSPEVIDTVIVPGLAFDLRGGRIGKGVGYYDRFLHQLAPATQTFGLAFDFQVLESLPQTENDVPVKKVVAEQKTINC